MNIETKIKSMLEEHGMWGKGVDAVMSKAKDEIPDMNWNDNISGYPLPLIAVIWLTTKRLALQWIDENLPRAWYRPMFVSESDGK